MNKNWLHEDFKGNGRRSGRIGRSGLFLLGGMLSPYLILAGFNGFSFAHLFSVRYSQSEVGRIESITVERGL